MNPIITVIIMTYNQKDYIAKAIDSILSQDIDVDFDILVHDDCSDDGTYQIILDKQKEYPNKIRIIRQESRKFLIDGFNMMIYKYVVPHIESKYVAYCDGDDYWCDNSKLFKQYDFMEKHPEYSMCFHSAYQLKRDGDMSSKWFIKDEGDIDMSNLINDKPGIEIATSSIFLKSEVFKDFSEWRKAYPVEDVPMYITAALYGKIHRLKDIMCVYRQFASGSWSSQNIENVQRKIDHLEKSKAAIIFFDEQTDKQYHDLAIKQIESCDFRIALIKKEFKTLFSKKYKRFIKRINKRERLALYLECYTPCLYKRINKG